MMDIPIIVTLHCRTGLDPESTSASRVEHAATVQLLFYCDSLFWLLGILGEVCQQDGFLIQEDNIHAALTHVGELGAALLTAAQSRADNLHRLAEAAGQERGGER